VRSIRRRHTRRQRRERKIRREKGRRARSATIYAAPAPAYPAGLGHALALAGRRSEARKLFDELKKLRIERNVAWSEVAVIYCGLNEKDYALAALDTATKSTPVS